MSPRPRGLGRAFDASSPGPLDGQSAESFWANADRSGGPDACWPWLDSSGDYGTTGWGWVVTGAHRVAYALAKGSIQAGQVVRHACDNPPCVNPAHLSVGTIADNNRDMHKQGRGRSGGHLLQGHLNHNAKLNDALVIELRAAWAAGESIKSIAQRIGLAVGTVHPMLHGKTWAHVGGGR